MKTEQADNGGALQIAMQCAKFFDNEMHFDDNSLLWVFSELQRSDKDLRKEVFEMGLKCRLRDNK